MSHSFRTVFIIKSFYGMPKPMCFISPLLLSAFSILLFCCGKEEPSPSTFIKGVVSDRETGLPIKGVNIFYSTITGNAPNEVSTELSMVSDDQGEYCIVVPPNERFSFPNVYKEGYLPKIDPAGALSFQYGDTNHVDIQLIPTDGYFKLRLKNDTGQFDSIYLKIESQTMTLEKLGAKSTKQYPVVLMAGEAYDETFAFPSNEPVNIYWDFHKFIIPDAMTHSEFLYKNDTVEVLISF